MSTTDAGNLWTGFTVEEFLSLARVRMRWADFDTYEVVAFAEDGSVLRQGHTNDEGTDIIAEALERRGWRAREEQVPEAPEGVTYLILEPEVDLAA